MRGSIRYLRAGTPLIMAAALAIGAEPSMAQYPLVPSPVFDSGIVRPELSIGGYLSVRETVRRDSSTFSINQARITVVVVPARFAVLKLQGNLAALGRTSGDTIPGFVLTDAYVQLSPPNGTRSFGGIRPTIILGQFKTPFSLEYLTGFSVLRTASRSQAVEQLTTRRDIGVMAHFAFRERATLAAGIMNGEGANSLSNANGRQLAIGRLTFIPTASVALAGKWAGEGSDHRWGYDVRWMRNGLVLEGERIERRAPLDDGITQRSAGHYLLASYRFGQHVQPVVKWEQFRDRHTDAGVTSETRLTWTTYGLNVMSTAETVRLQTNWIVKRERPANSANELVAQLIVRF